MYRLNMERRFLVEVIWFEVVETVKLKESTIFFGLLKLGMLIISLYY